MKNNTSKWLYVCLPVFMILLGAGQEGFGQQEKAEPVAETFFNLGYISYSSNYILSLDRGLITFKVRNNTSRPITNIFAWIYRTQETKDGETAQFLLVSNPNKGGILVKGGTHPPGETAEWRFQLIRIKESADKDEKFTLRVSPKSIYFGDSSLR